jgi:hypothetical protein
MLLIFFVSALLSLRVLPLIARRALPFSSEVRGVWAARRVLAKEHDSYQWMKLLWVGIGLTLYVLSTEDQRVSVLVLTTAALLAGGAGMVAWQRNTR